MLFSPALSAAADDCLPDLWQAPCHRFIELGLHLQGFPSVRVHLRLPQEVRKKHSLLSLLCHLRGKVLPARTATLRVLDFTTTLLSGAVQLQAHLLTSAIAAITHALSSRDTILSAKTRLHSCCQSASK